MDTWTKFIRATYHASPILQRRLDEIQDWYDPDLVEFISYGELPRRNDTPDASPGKVPST